VRTTTATKEGLSTDRQQRKAPVGSAPLATSTHEAVLQLQRTMGNRAVVNQLAVQRRKVIEQTVDSRTMTRLTQATEAIQYANNEVFKYGAGNQDHDIKATRGVAKARAENVVDRSNRAVTKDFNNLAEVDEIDMATPEILARYYKAGVCDDFSAVTLNYLRKNAPGQPLTRAKVAGLGHAFVIMGKWRAGRGRDSDSRLVVADPWPVRPQGVRWLDFFAYRANRADILPKQEIVADGTDVVAKHSAKVQYQQKKKDPNKLKLGDQRLNDLRTDLLSKHDLWNQKVATSTVRPVFYTRPNWSKRTKRRKRQEFLDALVLNKHLSWKEKDEVRKQIRSRAKG
jgi:hypothetical protein